METHLKPADLASYLEAPSIPEQALMSLFDPDTTLTIFDIGACEGEDSIRYCRRFPSARLFTFEALPANQGLIRENFVRYAITRAELVPLALSDRFGTAAFHVSSGRPKEEFAGKDWNYGNKSSSLLAPASSAPMHDWIEFRDSITVPTETLARFCSARGIRSIDFVHLDVQGAEGLVLAGAGPMLRQVGSLWLEVSEAEVYAGQPRRPELMRKLRAAGFALAFEAMHGTEGDQFWVNLRRPRFWLWLVARRGHAIFSRARFRAGAWKHRLLGGR
jgi:FkbM family methyltransferase